MTLIKRPAFVERAEKVLKSRPILAILGPRQCGKTTLAKSLIDRDFGYLDLERPSDLAKLSSDPELYLSQSSRPLIIDEAQRMPELFPILRAEADRRGQKGQFILLGSSSFQLIQSISESLSGRVGFLDLSPLGLFELNSKEVQLETHWLKGGFPVALLEGDSDRLNFDWFEDYTRTLIERDLPSLGVEITPIQFRRLWMMCAHYHGQLLNMAKMANSLDLSPHTVKRYLDILEQTFMVRRLPPLLANTKKRLVKSSKLYVRDSGMFHYFMRILSQEELLGHPDRGASFEGYVLELLLQIQSLQTPEFEPFFFRTSDQIEIDLVLRKGRSVVPIEIKSMLAPTRDACKSLFRYLELFPASQAYVIGMGKDRYPLSSKVEVIGIHWWQDQGLSPFWK